MPNELAGITRCTVQDQNGKPCGATFAGPAHIILGQNGASRMMALLEKLVNHLMEHHKSYFMNVMLEAQQYQGLLFMMPFNSTDKEFEEQRNYLRWSVHQQTLNASVSDDQLEGAAQAIAHSAAEQIIASIVQGLLQIVPGATVEETTRQALEFENSITRFIAERFQPEMKELRNALQEPVPPPNPLAPAAKPS